MGGAVCHQVRVSVETNRTDKLSLSFDSNLSMSNVYYEFEKYSLFYLYNILVSF